MFTIYGAQWCSHCKELKTHMETEHIEHEFIDIDIEINKAMKLVEEDLHTIPQVWHDDKYVGGKEDTLNYLQK